MIKHNYNVIGVMSGTSLDGVDLAHINFEIKNDKWTYEIVECETISYTNEMILKLKNGIHYRETELSELNIEYTNLLGNIISKFISKNNISNLDAVCSH
jgi:anhydro-N-acetylmuramic acid kinase